MAPNADDNASAVGVALEAAPLGVEKADGRLAVQGELEQIAPGARALEAGAQAGDVGAGRALTGGVHHEVRLLVQGEEHRPEGLGVLGAAGR